MKRVTHTAKAYITRRQSDKIWLSIVQFQGKKSSHVTGTHIKAAAVEYNEAHLRHILSSTTTGSDTRTTTLFQPELT